MPEVGKQVAAPTVGRFVQVNIGTQGVPKWRPALVTGVRPQEGAPVRVNVRLFLDGPDDAPEVVARTGIKIDDAVRASVSVPWWNDLPWGDGDRCWRWPPRE